MLNAILTGLVVFLGLTLTLWLAKRALINSLRAYFESPNDKTPSEFSQVTSQIAGQFGQQTALHIKQAILGTVSGNKGGQRAVEAAIVQEQAGQSNPLAGAILGSSLVKKAIKGNPMLAEYALQFLTAKMSKPTGQPAHRDNGPASLNTY